LDGNNLAQLPAINSFDDDDGACTEAPGIDGYGGRRRIAVTVVLPTSTIGTALQVD
jgi:hypothetical protein